MAAVAPLIGPFVAVVAVFHEALFGGRVFFERDIHAYWYPQVVTFVRVVGQRTWPLWDPYEGFGLPLLADPGSQAAYPLTWLNLVLLPSTVYKILVLGHALAGGAGVCLLARRWEMSPLAAGLAGVGWCVSGPLLSAASLYHHFCGAAWMPWVLCGLEAALAAPGRRPAAILGALAAGQALAGSADMCLLTALAGLGRLVFWLLAEASGPVPRRAAFATLAAAAALAFTLSAVQWVPTAALLGSVSRGRLEVTQNLYWSVHPLSLVDLFVPRFFADLPLSTTLRGTLFEGREPFLVSLYVGLPSLAAAALARRSGSPRWAYAAAMAGFFGLMALGRHAFLVPRLLGTPPLSLLRYPVKYLLPFAMFWALLAGFGVDGWRREWGPAEKRWGIAALVLMAALAAGAGEGYLWVRRDVAPAMRLLDIPPQFPAEASYLLRGKLGRTAALAGGAAALLLFRLRRDSARSPLALALSLLIAADLVAAGGGVNPLAPPELLEHRPRALDVLGPDIADHRLLAPAADFGWLNAHFVRGVAGWDRASSWALGLQDILAAPIAARWGIRGSFDADFTGLATPALPFLSGAVLRNQATPAATKLLRLGNVGYVVAIQQAGFRDLVEVGRVSTIFDAPVRVLKVPDPLPAAWLVGGSRPAESAGAAVEAIAEADFDPAREVVLGSGSPRVPLPTDFQGRCTILERRADRMVLEVEASAPGHVVVAEAYQRGWKAVLDGAPATVVPANLLFRAVAVPAGLHRLELRYRPASVFWGAGLSAAGLAALVLLLAPGVVSQRRVAT